MAALLSLIPGKDIFYGALIIALLLFGWHEVNHLKAEGATKEVAALKISSDKLVAQEAAHVALVAKTYAAAAANTQGKLDAQIQANTALASNDANRVREYNAYRSQHPAMASAGGTVGSSGQGTGSASQSEDFAGELGQAGVSLADALRDSNAALGACMKDRDDLTGKP